MGKSSKATANGSKKNDAPGEKKSKGTVIVCFALLLALMGLYIITVSMTADNATSVTAPPTTRKTSKLMKLKILPVPVEKDLDMHTFHKKYANKLPVVMELDKDQGAFSWTFSSLSKTCAGAHTPIFKRATLGQWAQLSPKGNVPFPEFIAPYLPGAGPRPTPHEMNYALEMWIKFECPSLLDDFTIPKWFTEDLLALVGPSEDAWPSLIVGAKGTQSGMHIDNNYLPFWLALYGGRKKLRILLANDTALHEYFDPQV